MTDLIACLSVGKGTWIEVLNLINSEEFENIYLIAHPDSKDRFKHENPNIHMILINPQKDIHFLIENIYDSLNGKIKGLEVALNINSGTGKEHMAVFSALLRLGIGIRQVIWSNHGIEEL